MVDKPQNKVSMVTDADETIVEITGLAKSILDNMSTLDAEDFRSGKMFELYTTDKYTYSIMYVQGTGIMIYVQ